MNSVHALALAIAGKSTRKVRLESGFCEEGQRVSIGGNVLAPIWLEHVMAEPGDPLTLAIVDYTDSTSSPPYVLGVTRAYVAQDPVLPLPIEGTIKTWAAGALTAVVATTQGDKTAVVLSSYTPVVSDRVRLLWQTAPNGGIVCTALAKIGAVTPPEPPAPPPAKPKPDKPTPPPAKPLSGSDIFPASNSGTWSTGTGSWNSRYGTDVMTGSGYYSPGSQRGAWFYHDKLSKLDGKTITKVQLWLPARRRVGNYNAPATFQVHLHTAKKRPGGDVTRVDSITITLPANSSGRWVELPTTWGALLISGHGIGLAGGDYAGFDGVKDNSGSGRLRTYWEA